MRTDDQAFNEQFDELKRRIAALPPKQRDGLESLADETVQRHEQTREAIGRARRAGDKLEVLLRLQVLQRFAAEN